MKNSFQRIKDRIQVPQNSKEVQNYLYYPDKILGNGNYSVVHEAISKTTRQKVAAKIINLNLYSDPEMLELLEQEIQILLTLSHRHIIKCHDILKTSEYCYCFTEMCQGGTLAQKIAKKGTLTQDQAWPVIKQLFEGLNYLHSKNIIHRDIKSSNIFFKGNQAKIADFGFAVQSRIPFKSLSIGSPIYMTPEGFIDGIYTLKTDVWAFGIVIYEMLHGKTPFSHIDNPELLSQKLTQQLQTKDFRADISPQLKQLMRKCLDVNQNQRISMPEIQFSYFMQKRRRLYFQANPLQTSSSNYSAALRCRSSSNIIRFPTKLNTISTHIPNSQNKNPEKLGEIGSPNIIRLKSTVKINGVTSNQCYSPVSADLKNKLHITTKGNNIYYPISISSK